MSEAEAPEEAPTRRSSLLLIRKKHADGHGNIYIKLKERIRMGMEAVIGFKKKETNQTKQKT